ncbi:adenylate/guanylate cyclase domain-containing protein [Solimonas sp. K1W22B-7]|uniref:adenylate/guanylate cyclase domain-containing protein n=1 Tax=Solimonas sp. K1W22B-7 TaxID=2303331 RepID=UPI000E32DB69|nr:adenylate/guanylate cyclase domain-containing protein [Solimonas sp. K1W22B-7]AXQ30990.1 adenylate/guanylate cyclase domain-containing protein [Solimonas sp. K1W22B-7]
MSEFTPHILVSIVALGMGLAFVSADRRSATSRALGAGLGLIGISIYLNVRYIGDPLSAPSWSGWLAWPEALAIVAILEWILRVRRTIPAAPEINVAFGDRVLRIGQLSGIAYGLFALQWPQLRVDSFLRVFNHPESLLSTGFWLFFTPVAIASLTGLVGIILVLNRRPDRAERVRILAMAIAVPFLVAGLLLPLSVAAISTVIGEVIFLVGAVQYHVQQGQRGQFLSRFLSPQVAQLVAERGLDSAMRENYMEITVVCCDLRGFTAFAAEQPSGRVLQVLREYYTVVGKAVADFGATIKDYAGDGILILVGAPLPITFHARCGIELARRIRSVTVPLTAGWGTETAPLGIGIGVASGVVTLGIIGTDSRLEYTAVGSTVNLASRLCDQALHGEILVAERTVELAGEIGLKARAPMVVKGYAEPVKNYSLMLDASRSAESPTLPAPAPAESAAVST